MPRRSSSAPYAPLVLNDFGKGLVLNRPAALLEPREAQVAENVDLRDGIIRRRSGYSQVGDVPDTTVAITGLFPKYDPAGDHELLAMAGDGFWKSTGGDFSAVDDLTPDILVGTQTNGTAHDTTGIVIDPPADISEGDLLFCHVVIANAAKTIVAPDGWTALGSDVNNRVFWRKYVATDFFDFTDPDNPVDVDTLRTFKASATAATEAMIGRMTSLSGQHDVSPINVSQESNGTDSTPDVTGVTTTADNCLVLAFLGNHQAAVLTSTPPGTVTERYDEGHDPGTAAAMTLGTKLKAAAGATGTEIFTLSGTPTAWRAMTVAVRRAEGSRPTFAQALETVYVATEDDVHAAQPLRKYDGTDLAVLSAAPRGRCVLFLKNALWLAGDGSSRVYWSKQIPNQETWPANNYVDVTPGDGDRITGLATLHGSVVVLKERSIAQITGYPPDDADEGDTDLQADTYTYRQPGCIAPRSVSANKTVVLYLNRQGVYAWNGTRAEEITVDIRPLFDTLNESDLKNAVGEFVEEDHYLLSLTTSLASEPNLVLSVRLAPELVITTWRGYPQTDLGAGQTTHNLKVTAITTFPFSGETMPVLGLKGKVVKMDDSFLDDTERIITTYRTGILPFGDASGQKLIRRGWLSAKPGAGRIRLTPLPNFATEDVESIDLDPSSVTVTGEEAVTIPIPALGSARRWAMELTSEGDGPAPEIHELAFEYFEKFRN